ncbi:MAG: phosphotransferase [Dehalococcoidia bacterium]
MDALDIERADGTRWKVSLRRFVREHRFSTPDHVAHEFDILRLAEAAGIPAPRPLLLDAKGELFGVPALVLSYISGRPLFASKNVGPWTDSLARALQTVHAVTPDRFDLSGLSVYLREGMQERIEHEWTPAQTEPLLAEIHPVLEAGLGQIDFSAPTLVHDDYWPGNTIWYRGRLAAIVDWTAAELGDPRADVAQCRVDLTISHGIEVADAFRRDYERLAGRPLHGLWFFDLFRGVRALSQFELWLKGYRDLGLHVHPAEVDRRLRTFLRRALAEQGVRDGAPAP